MKKNYINYKDTALPLLHEIPVHWDLKKLRFIGDFFSSGIDKNIIEGEHLVKIINYTDVYSNRTKILSSERNYMIVSCPESKLHQNLVNKGDLIFTPSSETVNEIGFSALVDEELENTAYSYHVLRFVFSRDIDHSYKKYLCNNNYVLNYFSSECTGSTRKILGRNAFKNAFIAIPPIEEQTKIAQYLDYQTTIIDQLIQQKEKLIELLKEKIQAVINEAVTNGLNPIAKMKDSEIDWLGEVPESWVLTPFRFLADKIGSGVTPKGGAEVYTEEGVIFIRSQNVHFNGLRLDDVAKIEYETHERMSGSKVKFNDVLLNITGASIGRCCVVNIDEEMNVNQHVCIIRPKLNKIIPEYLNLVLQSDIGQTQVKMELTGGNRDGLTFEALKAFVLPLPQTNVQNEIVSQISIKTSQFIELQTSILSQVEKLKEYRQSIISEAVTGKIDVREWQPKEQALAL